MGLSDSRPEPPRSYSFLRTVGIAPRSIGSPRFLNQSLGTRHPLPPRRAQQVYVPVPSLLILGFALFGRLATLIGVTRPNWVRLRYGSHPHRTRLRQADCSDSRSLGYVSNGQ